MKLNPGYTAQNGYVFTEYDCERCNHIQDEIDRFMDKSMPIPDGLLDHRARVFKSITGMK
jgi:hypothetical protein